MLGQAPRFARVVASLVIFSLVVPHSDLVAGTGDSPATVSNKELKVRAAELVSEGRLLESEGRLIEARDKFLDAEGAYSTDASRGSVKRVAGSLEEDFHAAIQSANRDFDFGKTRDSFDLLQRAVANDPRNPAAHYDLALCYLRLGDRSDAVAQIDLALVYLTQQKAVDELLDLRSSTLMDATASDDIDTDGTIAAYNSVLLDSGPAASDPGAPERKRDEHQALCGRNADLEKKLPGNAALLFNAAKCAEEDGKVAESAGLLNDYLSAAPNALDKEDVVALQADLASLAALEGDSGAAVRREFTAAARDCDDHHYDRAIADYRAAQKMMPDFALTEWQLALLYEAFGIVSLARAHFAAFQRITMDPQRKADAQIHMDSINARRAAYDSLVQQAQQNLTMQLTRGLGIDRDGLKRKEEPPPLATDYAFREFDRARKTLEFATAIFPLGIEANEMLGVVYSQMGNWPAAIRCFDIVVSQGFPVSFYAQQRSGGDATVVRAVKVELSQDAVRLVYLSSFDMKARTAVAPAATAGGDALGNLVVDEDSPIDAKADALTIHVVDINSVSAKQGYLVLKTKDSEFQLSPAYPFGFPRMDNPVLRWISNEYVRLFVRYVGFKGAKFGHEGMTSSEKAALVVALALVGLASYGAAAPMLTGGALAYGFFRAADVAGNLAMTQRSYASAKVAKPGSGNASIPGQGPVDFKTLQQASDDQRRAIEGLQFKIVPSHPVKIKFREEF